MKSKTLLAALLGGVAFAATAAAQSPEGYNPPDQPVVDQKSPPPAQSEDQRTLEIRTRRARRAYAYSRAGTTDRQDPMRTFPGYLPEKGTQPWTLDLDGNVITDARESQVIDSRPGRVSQPDTMVPAAIENAGPNQPAP